MVQRGSCSAVLLQRLIATSTAAVITITQVSTSRVGRGHIILVHQGAHRSAVPAREARPCRLQVRVIGLKIIRFTLTDRHQPRRPRSTQLTIANCNSAHIALAAAPGTRSRRAHQTETKMLLVNAVSSRTLRLVARARLSQDFPNLSFS